MSRRYLIAHDIDGLDDERFFVVDTRKAEGHAASWREADAIRAEIEKREGERR